MEEKKEKIFVDGLFVEKPHQNAPEWVKLKISVNVDKFTEFMKLHRRKGYINIDLKKSMGGKLYCELDTWKPEKLPNPDEESPF